MITYRLERGLVVQIDGLNFEFQRDLGKGVIQLENVDTGEYRTITKTELTTKIGNDVIKVISTTSDMRSISIENIKSSDNIPTFIAGLSENQLAEWELRKKYVAEFQKMGVTRGQRKLIKANLPTVSKKLNDTPPPSANTIIRWLRIYEISGNSAMSLLSKHAARRRPESLDENSAALVWDALHKNYFIKFGKTLAQTHGDYLMQVESIRTKRTEDAEKIQCVSLSTMARMAASLGGYKRDRARMGQSAAKIKWRHSVGGKTATRPLERVEMDHTVLDIYVIDDRTGCVLGRPVITLLVDTYSKYILSIYVSFENETLGRVCRAIQLMLRSKEDLTNEVPTECEWITPGKPETLVVDNSLAQQSPQLRQIGLMLGFDIEYCPVRSPWYKGVVERLMKEVQRYFPAEGRTEKTQGISKKINPVETARLKYSDLRRCLIKWAVDVHPFVISKRENTRPIDLLTEGLKNMPAAQHVTNLKALDFMVGLTKDVRVRHDGVSMNHLSYQSAQLAELAKRQSAPNFVATIRYDPNDLGRIWVCDPKDVACWIEVPCRQSEYANGLTLTQHKFIRSAIKENLNKKNAERLFLEKRSALEKMYAESIGTGKQLNKNLKKLIDLKSITPDLNPLDEEASKGNKTQTNEFSIDENFLVSDDEIPIFPTITPDKFSGWMH